jgi:TetR/AcrR family transcriptional regulator, repressor for neighboring sulfatase
MTARKRATPVDSPGSPRPRGREAVTAAILEAARVLIAERGPASVSLRDIAHEAKVNLGLVYKYVGTKEQLITEVTRRAAVSAAERLREVEHLGDALALLVTIGDGKIGRVLAWAALEGRVPTEQFGPSPALAVLSDLYLRDATSAGIDASDEDARLLAAMAMTAVLGWRVLGAYALTSAGLDPNEAERYDARIRSLAQTLGNLAVTRWTTAGEP